LLADVNGQYETAGRAAVKAEYERQLAAFVAEYTK